jgi:phage shock protein E
LEDVSESTATEREPEPGVEGRRIIVIIALAVAAVVAYFALGMPGMDHGGGSDGMASMDHPAMAVGVDEFASRLASSDAFVVNVHVPDEGSIEGTDARVPYDEIVDDVRLPANRDTPILLYCKTGRMSWEAATALVDAGYSDVVHLDGGMDAWVAEGRSLE